jgi:hypothetical protein
MSVMIKWVVSALIAVALPFSLGTNSLPAPVSQSTPAARFVAQSTSSNYRELYFADLEPGWSHTETFTVTNSTGAAASGAAAAADLVGSGGVLTNAERAVDPGNAADLGSHIHITATVGGETFYEGTLEGFAWEPQEFGTISPGSSELVVIRFEVESSTGAAIQGDRVTFKVGVALEPPAQASSEREVSPS